MTIHDTGYKWQQPKGLKGEHWWFQGHPRLAVPGPTLLGEVMMIDTRYDANGEAYHSYDMRVEGYTRRRHVGEESLIETLYSRPPLPEATHPCCLSRGAQP